MSFKKSAKYLAVRRPQLSGAGQDSLLNNQQKPDANSGFKVFNQPGKDLDDSSSPDHAGG